MPFPYILKISKQFEIFDRDISSELFIKKAQLENLVAVEKADQSDLD